MADPNFFQRYVAMQGLDPFAAERRQLEIEALRQQITQSDQLFPLQRQGARADIEAALAQIAQSRAVTAELPLRRQLMEAQLEATRGGLALDQRRVALDERRTDIDAALGQQQAASQSRQSWASLGQAGASLLDAWTNRQSVGANIKSLEAQIKQRDDLINTITNKDKEWDQAAAPVRESLSAAFAPRFSAMLDTWTEATGLPDLGNNEMRRSLLDRTLEQMTQAVASGANPEMVTEAALDHINAFLENYASRQMDLMGFQGPVQPVSPQAAAEPVSDEGWLSRRLMNEGRMAARGTRAGLQFLGAVGGAIGDAASGVWSGATAPARGFLEELRK